MNAPARLALYGAGLVIAFGGAFWLAGALVPDSVVTTWRQASLVDEHTGGGSESGHVDGDSPSEGH